ncbi:MAG: hypothetical protein WA894_00990 [Candidatus Acidiferrum sp.]
MPAARMVSQAVLAMLISSLVGSIPACSQSPDSFRRISLNNLFTEASSGRNHRTSSGIWLAKCGATTVDPVAQRAFPEETGSTISSSRIGGDSDAGDAPGVACAEADESSVPRSSIEVRCGLKTAGVPDGPGLIPCHELGDRIAPELLALGKEGIKIERAREAVVDILHSDSACTAWFETKDARPAATFQTLDFLIDRRGTRNVFESEIGQANFLVREPFVAQATQDSGAHTTITINAYGAFYRVQGTVERPVFAGGPLGMKGTRFLTVGGYTGDTLPAQMVTLLHEFGHIIDLLPEDADNLDGQSVRNTNEVLRHCRAEIEVEAQRAAQKAKRQLAVEIRK